MDFKIAIDAVLGFFQNILGYLKEGLLKGEPLALIITALLVVAFFTLLWRALMWKIIKKSTSTAHESVDEAVKAVIKQSLEIIKNDIDNRLSIIHGETKESVRAALLEFKKAELDSLSQSLTRQIKECRAEAEFLPEPVQKESDKHIAEETFAAQQPQPVATPEIPAQAPDTNGIGLRKINEDDVTLHDAFYLKNDLLYKAFECEGHSFTFSWKQVYLDASREEDFAKRAQGQAMWFLTLVCPECGKRHDVESIIKKRDQRFPELEDEDEKTKEEVHTTEADVPDPMAVPEPNPNPQPAPIVFREPEKDSMPDNITIAEAEKQEAEPDIPAPKALPINTLVVPSDEELNEEMQKANDNLTASIEEALKDDDAEEPETQAAPAATNPIAPTTSIYDKRPVLTYGNREQKEKRGFLIRITLNKQRRLEAKQEKEQRKRQKALLKWEQKRQRNKEILTEKIRKRKEKEAKRQRRKG